MDGQRSSALARFRPPMSRMTLLVVAAFGAVGIATVSAGPSLPYLRSAAVQRKHVVAVFALGELAPGQISVAARPGTRLNGAFLQTNVRLEEPIANQPGQQDQGLVRIHSLVTGDWEFLLVTETGTTFTYGDGYGNPTQVQKTTTDKDPYSPFFNSAWQSTEPSRR